MNLTNDIERNPRISDQRLAKKDAGTEIILVVEDEPDLLELVVQVLQSRGYVALGACSGKEALEHWAQQEHKIDLLLTDMTMPDGMTGSQLAERLKLDAPNLRVIFSSGHTAGIPGTQLAHVDERQLLGKPYRPSKLLEVVRNALDNPPPSPSNN